MLGLIHTLSYTLTSLPRCQIPILALRMISTIASAAPVAKAGIFGLRARGPLTSLLTLRTPKHRLQNRPVLGLLTMRTASPGCTSLNLKPGALPEARSRLWIEKIEDMRQA